MFNSRVIFILMILLLGILAACANVTPAPTLPVLTPQLAATQPTAVSTTAPTVPPATALPTLDSAAKERDARLAGKYTSKLTTEDFVTGGVKPVLATFLGANYPNPFHGSTSIPLGLKTAGVTKLAVFDVAGRLVKTLIDGPMEAGSRVVEWDGRDDGGRSVASGFYVIRLTAPDDVRTRSVKIVR